MSQKIKIKIKANLNKHNDMAIEKKDNCKLKAVRNLDRMLENFDDEIPESKFLEILKRKRSIVNLEALEMLEIDESYTEILIEEDSVLEDLLKNIAEEL